VGDPALFPPEIIVSVKALACQLPKELGLPFSRLTHEEIARQAEKQGIVASISGKTVWRWLSKDAIRPWCYRSWIWPRDPDFEQKAARVLDLYHGFWEGKPLSNDDFIISSDEKTSIQARRRLASVTAPKSGFYGRVEHEYERMGSLAYMAAWDVRQAKIFGLCSSGCYHRPRIEPISPFKLKPPLREGTLQHTGIEKEPQNIPCMGGVLFDLGDFTLVFFDSLIPP